MTTERLEVLADRLSHFSKNGWMALAQYVDSLMRMAAMDEAERISKKCHDHGCHECSAMINEESAPWNIRA